MLKIESGNEALTDGQTDVRTDGQTLKRKFLNGGYNIIPALLKWRGIIKSTAREIYGIINSHAT